jgi:hypothetical protein
MTIAWAKVLPVVISIFILIAIAIIREYSRTLAAITATMPVMIPLSLWIIFTGEGGEHAGVIEFTDAMVLGIIPTVVFIIVVAILARTGASLLPMLLGGYGAWGLTLGVVFLLRQVLGTG